MIFINPLTLLVRKIALHRHASTASTQILPIGEIKRATVFVDMDADADIVSKDIRKFFDSYSIPVQIISPQKWDINLFGWMKKPKMKEMDDWDADIFISLAGPENFTAEYASRCSKARFKVGRFELPTNVYDLVIANREHQLPRQPVAFTIIKEYLLKII